MNHTQLFPILLAGVATILVVAIGLLVMFYAKRNSTDVDYDEQLEELLMDDDAPEETKITLITKWNNYWSKLFKTAGIARYNEENSNAGRDVAFGLAFAAVFLSVLMQNIFAGPGIVLGVTVGGVILIKNLSNKKIEDLNYQLPGFIFALKANLQTATSNEQAMQKVIRGMPSPLYDDLKVLENVLLSGAPFAEGLEALSRKTASKDLKFLAACMIQADSSGANLVQQLDEIQKVLEARKKVEDEIKKAVKAASPAIWLSTAAIPGVLLFSYFFDPQSHNFWFSSLISWVVLLIVAVLYVASLVLVRKQVEKIKNM